METKMIEHEEYNEEEMRNIIIENLAFMISSRYIYKDVLTFEELHSQLKETNVPENSYMKFSKNDINIGVLLYRGQLKKIDSSDMVGQFLNTFKGYKIIIAKKVAKKVLMLYDESPTTEIVFFDDLTVKKSLYILNPTFIQLSLEEQEQVKKEYNFELHSMPIIKKDDAMSKFYRLAKNEIVKIETPSPSSGIAVHYRIRE